MAFTLTKATEPLQITNLKILIYGEPGAGKTSLSFTAEKPFLLDFDKGAHRAGKFRKDAVRIDTWQDIVGNLKELDATISNYNTIIIDTVETCLEYIGTWIIDREPKYNTPKYKLPFYGELKDQFAKFINHLLGLGKDIIMIAHAREEMETKRKTPHITGSSSDKVLQLSDMVGQLFKKDNRSILDFNPTDTQIGKNSGQVPVQEIPNFAQKPNYAALLIEAIKKTINGREEEIAKTISLAEEYKNRIDDTKSVDEFNEIVNWVRSMNDDNPSKLIIKGYIKKTSKHRQYIWSEAADGFVEQSAPEPEFEQPKQLELAAGGGNGHYNF